MVAVKAIGGGASYLMRFNSYPPIGSVRHYFNFDLNLNTLHLLDTFIN